jgi:hypothetical protein
MSEGTPLDALETGDVSNEADSARMAQILQDMNASGGAGGDVQPPMMPPQPMPPMLSMQPMMQQRQYQQQQQQQQQHQQQHKGYIPVAEEEYRPRKKNVWSNIVERLRDPIIVSILFFVLSLPMLHTQVAKIAGWAFAVGGQLSWLGLAAFSALAGLLFAVFQGGADLIGL